MDLQEVLWEGMEGVDLAQVRERWYVIVNAVMNSEFLKFGEFFDWLRNC